MRVTAMSPVAGNTASTTTLPCFSVYASATMGLTIREVGAFNTTTTACRYGLVRLSTAGTQGTGQTEVIISGDPTSTIQGTSFTTHSVAPTLNGFIAPMPLGAAIGAGTILSFYGENAGLYIPKGTANGIGIILLAGTGQVSDTYIIWDE